MPKNNFLINLTGLFLIGSAWLQVVARQPSPTPMLLQPAPAAGSPTSKTDAAGSTAADDAVQWASRVIGVSSEGKGETFGKQYKAVQALGKPSKLPLTGDSPCAWSPLYPDNLSDDWIRVGFDKAVPVRQIVVGENVNPGAVVRVSLFDEAGKETVVYTNDIGQVRTEPVLSIFPKEQDLVCKEVKVVINGSRTKGPNQIDAIGISSSRTPVLVGVNVAPNTPKELLKENLGKTVNSPGLEVAPVISPDGKTLYFTRSDHKGNIGKPDRQDVWYSTLTGGGGTAQWGEAINIGAPINNTGDNAISGLSLNGRTMYLLNVYKPNGELSYGLSRSIKTKAGWSFPVECKIKNNYNLPKNEHDDETLATEYAIGPDGKVLLMGVRRKDTQGERDLYVSFLQPDQTWSEPLNLGAVVNTADAESSPFLAADGRTLYYTSAGHAGFGDGDIFVCRRLDETWTNWSEPENLGSGINTAKWDGYFTIPATGDFAYLSSADNSLGQDDIFRVRLFPAIKPDPVAIISGVVLDAQTKKPLDAEVISGVPGDKKEVNKVEYSPETGEFKMLLPTQKSYTITATKEGYFPVSETIDLSRDKRFRDIRRTLYMIPVKSGQKIVMRELLFEQSKAELQNETNAELDHVAEMMKQHPEMEILVEGHTDNQGDWEPNVKLSQDRVEVVKKYLTGQGVAEKRIQTKAWGPSKPIASNETEEKRRQNRRVEFTILKL